MRTGNAARADNTWSEFTPVAADGKIDAPSGRYVQFRVTMTTSDTETTPVLNFMDFSYAEILSS